MLNNNRSFSLGLKKLEHVLFAIGIQQGKSDIYFLVLGEKQNKGILTKNRKCSLGPRKLGNMYHFTAGIQQGKSGIHFLVFGAKEYETILTKQLKQSLGPNKSEKVLFYNENSRRKIWHTIFVFGEQSIFDQ